MQLITCVICSYWNISHADKWQYRLKFSNIVYLSVQEFLGRPWMEIMSLWLFLIAHGKAFHSTVEPLTNDHPHQRPSLSYDHISCDGQWFLFVYESLTSDHPSYTTTPMWFWGWSYKRGSTVMVQPQRKNGDHNVLDCIGWRWVRFDQRIAIIWQALMAQWARHMLTPNKTTALAQEEAVWSKPTWDW